METIILKETEKILDANYEYKSKENIYIDIKGSLQIEDIKHKSLSVIYRQSNDSSIVDLAYRIRHSKLDESFKFNGDVSFIKIRNIQAADFIVSILTYYRVMGEWYLRYYSPVFLFANKKTILERKEQIKWHNN